MLLLQKRAQLLCDPNDFGQSSPDWSKFHKEILQVSCKVGTSRMMILIRSWLNSWTTRSCMEQEIGDCVSCCGGGDALHHYLRCDHLWTLLISCTKLDKKWLFMSPAHRLGLVEPSTTSQLSHVFVCLRTSVWKNKRLGTLAWKRAVGNSRLITFAWGLRECRWGASA